MTHHLPAPADLARAFLAERLINADGVRAGRLIALERRSARRHVVGTRVARLVTAFPAVLDVSARAR